MPKDMHLAARNAQGDAIVYHENSYPPAEIVEIFERYAPGSAKDLLKMASDDQRNAHELEKKKANQQTLGMWFGFILSVLLVLTFSFLMYTGHWVAGASSILMAFITLATTFAMGRTNGKSN